MINLVQTKIAPQNATIFKKEGTFEIKPIFLLVKIRGLAAANFRLYGSFDPIGIFLLLLKISRIFLVPIATACIKLCLSSYFRG
jgi:hypothetical protein